MAGPDWQESEQELLRAAGWHLKRERMMIKALIFAAAIQLTVATCPSGDDDIQWIGGGSLGKCYFISEDSMSFTECQEYVCGEAGGTLVKIESAAEDHFIRRNILKQNYAWIGLFEAGEDESGDWQWVSGGDLDDFESWESGEPNNWCEDEDCGLIGPSEVWEGWVDVSCNVDVKCICQSDSDPSDDYYDSVDDLEDAGEDYEDCEDGDEEELEEAQWEKQLEMSADLDAIKEQMTAVLVLVSLIFVLALCFVAAFLYYRAEAMKAGAGSMSRTATEMTTPYTLVAQPSVSSV